MDRVLIVGLSPANNGITSAVMNFWYGMDLDDVQADFLLMGKSNYDFEPTKDFLADVEAAGGRIFRIPYSWVKVSARSRRAFAELLASEPEIRGIHNHTVGITQSTAFNYRTSQAGLPVNVIHVHSGQPPAFRAKPDRALRGRLNHLRDEGIDRLACSANAIYSAYREVVEGEFFPNAIDLKRFRLDPILRMATRRGLGLADDEVALLLVGTMYKAKNPEFALKIFREYCKINPKAHIYFVGGGRDEDLIKEMEEADSFPLADRIHLMGNSNDVELYYNAADVLMVPSRQEGLPNVLVEAQACGLPCLVSDVVTREADLADLILYRSLDEEPEAWARGIAELLEAHPQRRSYTEEVRAAGFDRLDAGRRLTALYRRRIDEARG